MSEKRTPREIRVLGVPIHPVTRAGLVAFAADTVERGERALLGYVNLHALDLARHDARFRDYLERADLAFCDGFGVRLVARLVGEDVGERNTPPDWIDALCRVASERGYALYFLGAAPGVAEAAAAALRERHPGLWIAGARHGYFDKTRGSAESQSVVAAINDAAPDLLIVGFGMPAQERWLLEHWDRLDVAVGIPVGAMFDYVAGTVRRGPRWMTDRGLEWLARLAIEPRRLWTRYLVEPWRLAPRLAREIVARRRERE